MVEKIMFDEVNEYDKFLWIPKKVGYKWVWLKKIHVVEKSSEMIIGGKVTDVKKVEVSVKEG